MTKHKLTKAQRRVLEMLKRYGRVGIGRYTGYPTIGDYVRPCISRGVCQRLAKRGLIEMTCISARLAPAGREMLND